MVWLRLAVESSQHKQGRIAGTGSDGVDDDEPQRQPEFLLQRRLGRLGRIPPPKGNGGVAARPVKPAPKPAAKPAAKPAVDPDLNDVLDDLDAEPPAKPAAKPSLADELDDEIPWK